MRSATVLRPTHCRGTMFALLCSKAILSNLPSQYPNHPLFYTINSVNIPHEKTILWLIIEEECLLKIHTEKHWCFQGDDTIKQSYRLIRIECKCLSVDLHKLANAKCYYVFHLIWRYTSIHLKISHILQNSNSTNLMLKSCYVC